MVVFSPNICHLSIQYNEIEGFRKYLHFGTHWKLGWLIKTGDTDKLLLSPLSVILSAQL